MTEDQINASLQSTLTELEVQRKEVSAARLKSYALMIVGVAIVAIGFLIPDVLIFAAVGGVTPFIVALFILSKASEKFQNYRHEFKHRVIAAALKQIDQSMELQYNDGLSERNFIESQLFTHRPDRFKSQDQVYGKAGKTQFSFSEVHAEYKTVTQSKHGRREHWHDIFKGIIFCADFNKHFNGVTVVRPKDVSAAFGAWISDKMPIFSSSGRDIVKLENTEFCEAFVTYSTDQVEARYILTPSMMERLCELNGRSRYTISLSFIDSYVYLAFSLSKDYFEPPVFKSLLDGKFLEEDLGLIRFMYGIIAELDLNTRIWTKQ